MYTHWSYMGHHFRLLELSKLSCFLCRKAYRLTNVLSLSVFILKKNENHIEKERNDWLVFPYQQIASFQSVSKPECLDNQAFSFLSDFRFVCFRGRLISLFRVSVHENVSTLKWKLCLCFSPWKKLCPYLAKYRLYANVLTESSSSCL